MKLLEEMCSIHSPSGEEEAMSKFLLNYIKKNKKSWKNKPKIYSGELFQDNIILVFGKPTTAIFAHMDSIGYTVRYNNEIVKIGGAASKDGIKLVGEDSQGKIEGKIINKKNKLFIKYKRNIETGTTLTYKSNFRKSKDFVQCCYLDNRLGVWNALEVAKTLNNGIIVFSSWEEHGGGSVNYLSKFIYKKYNIKQALISDITWITEGVKHNNGCVISIRDSGIPRRSYVNRIIEIAKRKKIKFQIEVEGSGGSDGNELQKSAYPWDWCFIGAPEDNVHTPDEKVHINDIKSMVNLYAELMKEL